MRRSASNNSRRIDQTYMSAAQALRMLAYPSTSVHGRGRERPRPLAVASGGVALRRLKGGPSDGRQRGEAAPLNARSVGCLETAGAIADLGSPNSCRAHRGRLRESGLRDSVVLLILSRPIYCASPSLPQRFASRDSGPRRILQFLRWMFDSLVTSCRWPMRFGTEGFRMGRCIAGSSEFAKPPRRRSWIFCRPTGARSGPEGAKAWQLGWGERCQARPPLGPLWPQEIPLGKFWDFGGARRPRGADLATFGPPKVATSGPP